MLKTPVQFEPAFEGLNEVRPLRLADRVKTNLDIPVCNANPVSSSRRAAGKLLQCNNVGGMLENGIAVKVDNYEYQQVVLYAMEPIDYLLFSQKVKGVSVYFTGDDDYNVAWCIDEGGYALAYIFRTHFTWFSFTGLKMWFYHFNPGRPVVVRAYGFY